MILDCMYERTCGRAAAEMVDTAESTPHVEVYTVAVRNSIRRLWLRTGKKSWIRMESDARKMHVDPSSYEMEHDWRGPLSEAVRKFDAVSELPVLALLGFRVPCESAYAEQDVKRWAAMLRRVKRAELAFGMASKIAEQNGQPFESWDAACKRVMGDFMEERLYVGFGNRRTSVDQMVRHAASVIGVVGAGQRFRAARCAASVLHATGFPFDGHTCKHRVILLHERAARAKASQEVSPG